MTADADRDAIALIRASLRHDEEAMVVILRNCVDVVAMVNCMAELYSHGTRRECNDPDEQLGRCLANVDRFIATHDAGDRRLAEILAYIADHPDGAMPDDEEQR
jgi:hypothetical protein